LTHIRGHNPNYISTGDFQLKRIIAGLLIAMICFSAPMAFAEEKVVDGIVAVVNGDILTMYELN